MDHSQSSTTFRATTALVLAIVAIALSLAGYVLRGPSSSSGMRTTQVPGLLERIERDQELHAGYGVYPPYTQEDPVTKAVSGYSVELIEQIAKELNCKVVWHRLNWNTMSADLKRGEYDVIAGCSSANTLIMRKLLIHNLLHDKGPSVQVVDIECLILNQNISG